MLNRRLIRVKILQLLYGFYRDNGLDGRGCERQLINSLTRYPLLVHYISYLPVLMVEEAKERIARGKTKYRPSYEELHPNTRFVDNEHIALFAANKPFVAYSHHHNVNWTESNSEFLSLLFDRLIEQPFYRDYMAGKSVVPTPEANDEGKGLPSADTDAEELPKSNGRKERETAVRKERSQWDEERDFTLTLLDWLCHEEMVEEALSTWDLYWTTDLEFAVDTALHAWRNLSPTHPNDRLILEQLVPPRTSEYASQLMRILLATHRENHQLVVKAVHNWDPERISAIDLLIIEIGVAEALHFPDIPLRVTLNECIEIARSMSTPQSPSFVNGVLDKIVTELKEQGKVLKNDSYTPKSVNS